MLIVNCFVLMAQAAPVEKGALVMTSTIISTDFEAQFGATAVVGDWNDDGFDDVVVGAPGTEIDGIGLDDGGVYSYLGSATGLDDRDDWSFFGGEALPRIGLVMATAGDVNGDGFDDLILGAPAANTGVDGGAAVLFLGSVNGLENAAAWEMVGGQPFAAFGSDVASAGDVNGDGLDDVLVSAEGWDEGNCAGCGKVDLFLGSATGLETEPAWTYMPTLEGEAVPMALASAGDVNGDGFDDVAIGQPDYDSEDAQDNEGRVRVFYGSATGPSNLPDWEKESNQINAAMGWALTSADVNGDGYSDLAIGSPRHLGDTVCTDQSVTVHYGSANGLKSKIGWKVRYKSGCDTFGSTLAAGDLNGDGFDDLAVGAPYYTNTETFEGQARAYLGSAIGPGAVHDWSVRANGELAQLSTGLASGDFNGDSLDEVVVGAPGLESQNNLPTGGISIHEFVP